MLTRLLCVCACVSACRVLSMRWGGSRLASEYVWTSCLVMHQLFVIYLIDVWCVRVLWGSVCWLPPSLRNHIVNGWLRSEYSTRSRHAVFCCFCVLLVHLKGEFLSQKTKKKRQNTNVCFKTQMWVSKYGSYCFWGSFGFWISVSLCFVRVLLGFETHICVLKHTFVFDSKPKRTPKIVGTFLHCVCF